MKPIKILFAVIILTSVTTQIFGEDFIPKQVILTWQGDTSTTMTVTWRTDSFYPEQAELFYSDDDTLPLQDYKVKEADSFMFDPSPAVIHTAELTGLQPDTEYYVVLDHPSDPESFSFRTAPAVSEEIVFLAGGDSRPPGEDTRRIINDMAAAEEPDFIIFAGDFINSPLSESEWDHWFDDWHEQLITEDGRRIPIVPAIGNHEVDGGYRQTKEDAPYYYNRFMLPDPENYYALTYGPDMLIVTLDSHHTMRVEEQNEWLAQTLSENEHYPLKIVQYHIAAWPSVRSFNSGIPPTIRENWIPIIEQYGVDIVVEAHDHAYKMTEPIRRNRVDPNEGVIYTGDGGWGAPLREVRDADEYWWLKEAESIDHFWKFTLSENGDQLHVEPVFYGDPSEGLGEPFTIELRNASLFPVGASAQGENADDNETADKAFDGNVQTKWVDFSPTGSWIQWHYGHAEFYEATDYVVTSAVDHPERDPMGWQLHGSNDGGATWDTLDTRTDKTFTSRSQSRRFPIENPGEYNIYRLEITEVAGEDSADAVQIAELEFLVCLGPGDLNCDGMVNVSDLSYLADVWLTDDIIISDISESSADIVNFLNFSVLADSWLMGVPLPDTEVPDVIGQDQTTAQADIESADLAVGVTTSQYSETEAAGTIIDQDPEGGSFIEMRSWVDLLVSSGPADEDDRDWTNASGDRLWRNSANWSDSSLPGHLNKAGIRDSSIDGPIIDSRTVVEADTIPVGDMGNTGSLEMTGGSVTTERWLILGFGSSDEGSFDLSDGTVVVGSNMSVARLGSGTLTMTGGSITVDGPFRIAQGPDSSGEVFLDGGTISVDDFIMTSGGWLDITEGTLLIDGNAESDVNDYISNGWITAYDGDGTVEVDYDITNSGMTTVTASSGS